MYELTGDLISREFLSFDAYGRPIISFRFNEKLSALNMFEELKGCEKITVRVSKFKKKRSLDANAYAWVLISKIAEKTNVATNEVYRSAIKEIGGNSETVCVQDHAVASLCAGWSRNGLGWCTDTLKSKIDGCTNVILYYGSSTYDTKQMNRLVNILVQECEQLGIETKSPAELDSLLGAWEGR